MYTVVSTKSYTNYPYEYDIENPEDIKIMDVTDHLDTLTIIHYSKTSLWITVIRMILVI